MPIFKSVFSSTLQGKAWAPWRGPGLGLLSYMLSKLQLQRPAFGSVSVLCSVLPSSLWTCHSALPQSFLEQGLKASQWIT